MVYSETKMSMVEKKFIRDLIEMKNQRYKISAITCYDATFA